MTAPPRSVITIGSFDGVHLGHRAILRQARAWADRESARVLALTFDPHPVSVLRPGAEPPRLLCLPRKIQELRAAGAHEVVVLPPTPELLAMTPRAFIEKLVIEHRPGAIFEGPDFRFGKGRAGDLTMLAEMGREFDFQCVVVERTVTRLSDLWEVPVSSSLVRWLTAQGRVADAALALGRPVELRSTVVRGEQRGRTLGFPTLNLDLRPLHGFLLPAQAVYAGQAILDDQCYAAAVSIGTKPSFGRSTVAVEAHLLDFTGEAYGRSVCLRLTRHLRDQTRFPSVELLVAQLRRDVEQVRGHALKERRSA